MKVGDYVRTDNGEITKIKDIWENERIFFENIIKVGYIKSDSIYASQKEKYIIKSSPNIIDLIEVGDYVNGNVVKELNDELVIMNTGLIYDNNLYLSIKQIDIKSIVTKEQFEGMEYKVN